MLSDIVLASVSLAGVALILWLLRLLLRELRERPGQAFSASAMAAPVGAQNGEAGKQSSSWWINTFHGIVGEQAGRVVDAKVMPLLNALVELDRRILDHHKASLDAQKQQALQLAAIEAKLETMIALYRKHP